MLLNEFDKGEVSIVKSNIKSKKQFTYESIKPAIDKLKVGLIKSGDATDLFGNERDGSFGGILKTIGGSYYTTN